MKRGMNRFLYRDFVIGGIYMELTERHIIAYTEAWRVIQMMSPEDKKLIPQEALEFLDKHKDLSKGVKINPLLPLEKQGLSEDTLCVLGGIMLEIRRRNEMI